MSEEAAQPRLVIFRVLAGLVSLLFVPSSAIFIVELWPHALWAFGSLFTGMVLGYFAVTGRAPKGYVRDIFTKSRMVQRLQPWVLAYLGIGVACALTYAFWRGPTTALYLVRLPIGWVILAGWVFAWPPMVAGAALAGWAGNL